MNLSGRMGYKIFKETDMLSAVNYVDFHILERTLPNGETSCSTHVYDDCIYTKMAQIMKYKTEENCTVPWIMSNAKGY